MLSILWADDQRAVAESMSAMLREMDCRITFVESGTEAINAIANNYFDLALIDLMMPPEVWGGLWFLEESNRLDLRVPVLVLSGEGTQNETIKALRLGARDYITKESAGLELLDRMHKVVEGEVHRVRTEFIGIAPCPLALTYNRYISAMEPLARLHRLIEFYETYLKLCVIVYSVPRKLDR